VLQRALNIIHFPVRKRRKRKKKRKRERKKRNRKKNRKRERKRNKRKKEKSIANQMSNLFILKLFCQELTE